MTQRSTIASHACRLVCSNIFAGTTDIADAGGLDKVTIRKLAAELDVATMALYRYVDILEFMADAVQAELSPSESCVNWRDGDRNNAGTTYEIGRLEDYR